MITFDPSYFIDLSEYPVAQPPDFTCANYIKRRDLVEFLYSFEHVRPRDKFRVVIAIYSKEMGVPFDDAVEAITLMINTYGKMWTSWRLGLSRHYPFPHYEPEGTLIATSAAWYVSGGKHLIALVPINKEVATRIFRQKVRLKEPIRPYTLKRQARKRTSKSGNTP